MRRQRRDNAGWEPLGEEKGNAFGQALRDAVTAGTPKTSNRNIFRLVEGENVSLCQTPSVEALAEVVEVLPSGLKVRDRRRIR
jgi:hypothetical protein